MNKNELISTVASKSELNKAQIAEVINTTIETIKETLASSEEIRLTGFINFEIKDIEERQGRNPKTGSSVTIPAHKLVKAKLADTIKNCLR